MRIHFLVTIAVTYKQYFQKNNLFQNNFTEKQGLPPYKHSATAP